PKRIKFPFGDTAASVRGEINVSVDIHDAIGNVLESFQPYEGALNSLWNINYLANSKKHRWRLKPFPVNDLIEFFRTQPVKATEEQSVTRVEAQRLAKVFEPVAKDSAAQINFEIHGNTESVTVQNIIVPSDRE